MNNELLIQPDDTDIYDGPSDDELRDIENELDL